MAAKRTAHGATTLEAKYYTSADVFRLETDMIFNRHWLCVGRESEVATPGSVLPVEVEGESLILVRDRAGQLHGYFNVCRHRGTRLCQTAGADKKTIVCPYHGWTYGLNGELLAAPNMDDLNGAASHDLGLVRVAAVSNSGFLFVNFSDSSQVGLPDAWQARFDPWLPSQLITVHRQVYEVRANWKLLFQNYNECYHCPRIHPALNLLSSYKSASNDVEEGPLLGGPMQLSDQASSMTTTGRACAAALPGLSELDKRRVYYYSLFPTLLLSPHPDYVMVHRVERLSAQASRVTCEFLFHPEAVSAPTFDPEPAVEFWDQTNRQDWHVCELSQLGVASRAYSPGPYSGLECTVAAFDRYYLQALGCQPEL